MGRILWRRCREWLWQERYTPSLRTQVAIIIIAFSFLPNLILFGVYLLTSGVSISPIFWLNVSFWLLFLVIISSWTGYVLSRVVMQPLTHLAHEISHLVAPHQLSDRPNDPREALIVRLALQDLLRQLRTEQQRRAAFMATLMHDLKTPLIAFQHLLRALPRLPNEQQKAVIDQVLSESDRLLGLVQKLVDAQRLERGQLQLRRQPCDLALLAQGIVHRCQPLANQRQIHLFLSGQGSAFVDPYEIERALYNLVDNALRYAHKRVEITVDDRELCVCDDGPGLPAPLSDLIKPFQAVPIAIAGEQYAAGTGGLGLFIAHSIINAHRGHLCDRSDATQTCLMLKLPSAEAAAAVIESELPEV